MNSWNPFKYPPRAVIKSVWAFLLPGFAILLNAFTEAQSDPTDPVTGLDYIIAGLTAFVTGYTVFAVQNTPPGNVTPAEADNNEGGYAGVSLVLLIVGILLIAIAVLALFKVLAISLAWVILLVIAGFLLLFFAHR